MQSIDESLLEGAVSEDTLEPDTSDADDLYGKGDDAADEAFEKGINLLTQLSDLLEQGRDTLYIDEYILANFRNYVHHVNMDSSKAGKTEKKGIREVTYDRIIAEKFLQADFKKKQHMVGEVEYILAGNTNQYLNVAYVCSQILLIRTAFNMAAMFTDTSMYQQASSLTIFAGPFAPLATFALMVAWAVAESVIDVTNIMQGEKVLLFKQGKDWELSTQGAISNAIDGIFDAAVSAVEEVAMNYLNQFETKYDAAIYDYYVNSASMQNSLNEVSNYVK